MTARLILICHAPTAATRAARFPLDEALDDGGRAALARAALPSAATGGWLTGPERRARDTAAGLGRAAAIDGDLRDQGFGRWAGRTLAEVAEAERDGLAAWSTDPAAAPHGGESVLDVLARVEAWMAARASNGGRSAAVTHPAVVRAAVVAALGADAASFWRIEAPPLATATLSHDGRRWTLAGLAPPPRPPVP